MNFTVVDTLGVLKAFASLAPFMFAPGYALGWALNVFQFRQRPPVFRAVVAVPLSIALCPILSYLLARYFQPGMWAFYLGASAACLLLLAKASVLPRRVPVSRYVWIALGLATLWGALATATLVDLQTGDQLYSPIAAYDHSTRVAVMAAIARHTPPNNPFFAHPAVPLRYHYLWMLLCSLPLKVFHVSARHLMYAGILWCGIGLGGLVALGLKFLVAKESPIAPTALVAAALLCVTGLDILPILFFVSKGWGWLADMEWWNQAQITSWIGSLLWVPHHVAALIACFLGFLLLRHEADLRRASPARSVLLAGFAFASAAGLSIYVTFTFVIAIGLWLMIVVARKEWKEVAMFAGAGAVALAVALPYLRSLSGPGSGTAFVEFALRPFSLGAYIAEQLGFAVQTPAAKGIINLISLPFNYALELGFFFAIGIMRLRRLLRGKIPATGNELAAWTLVAASFVVGTFMRSSTITTNDLGFRCFLPAQLILLLWGAVMIGDWWSERKTGTGSRKVLHATFAGLLFVGLLSTGYQVFMIRIAPILSDRTAPGIIAGEVWLESDRRTGKHTHALRSIYEALDPLLPASAVIQHNPATPNGIPHGLYSGHEFVAGGNDCGTAFGGDPRVCAQRVANLVALFELNRGTLESICREYNIDVVLAKDTDRAWHDPSSWVWNETPLLANDYVRAFRCDTAPARSSR